MSVTFADTGSPSGPATGFRSVVGPQGHALSLDKRDLQSNVAIDDVVPKQRVYEEFSAKGRKGMGQSVAEIALGHYKNKQANKSNVFKDDFVKSAIGPAFSESGQLILDNKALGVGLQSTKFGQGFNRRQESNIINPAADAIREHAREVQQRAERAERERCENLRRIDSMSGFNIISHEIKGDGPKQVREGKKKLDGRMSDISNRNGQIMLRDSMGKFFMPQGSGHRHAYRQHVILHEGVYEPRCSSIIQIGSKDLPSYGIEDNFSKSQYTATGEATKRGLAEMKLPGKFTPRKQPGNPSGDDRILKNWTCNVKETMEVNRMLASVNFSKQYP